MTTSRSPLRQGWLVTIGLSLAVLLPGCSSASSEGSPVPPTDAGERTDPADPDGGIPAEALEERPATPPGESVAAEPVLEPADDELTGPAFAAIRGRLEMMSWDPAYGDVTEALPNVEFDDADRGTYRVSDIVVRGSVTQVSAIVAAGSQPDSESEADVPVGSGDALWQGFELIVTVEEVLALSPEVDPESLGETVSVLVPTSPDLTVDQVRADYARSEIVVVGRRDGVVEQRPDLFSIVGRGSFWLEVAEDGTLSAPVLDNTALGALVPPGLSLEELRALAQEPRTLRPLWERSSG